MSTNYRSSTKDEILDEIKKGAVFVRYYYCFSVIILSFKRTSEPQLVTAGKSPILAGLPWTALTLVTGWWGIPWGPIWSISCIAKNMRGGDDITDDVVNLLI